MPDIPSTKPYLLRAIYEWCVDNGFTPYVSVQVNAGTRVPMEYVRDGVIVLNIGPLASHKLSIGKDRLECVARFGGVAREISVPVDAISEIYARENGLGMAFPERISSPSSASATDAQTVASELPPEPPKSGGRPHLRRIK